MVPGNQCHRLALARHGQRERQRVCRQTFLGKRRSPREPVDLQRRRPFQTDAGPPPDLLDGVPLVAVVGLFRLVGRTRRPVRGVQPRRHRLPLDRGGRRLRRAMSSSRWPAATWSATGRGYPYAFLRTWWWEAPSSRRTHT